MSEVREMFCVMRQMGVKNVEKRDQSREDQCERDAQ